MNHPGERLKQILQEKFMTQSELALRMGRPQKTISEIINGKASITYETAIQLEHVLGIPAPYWSTMQKDYDVEKVKQRLNL